MLTFATGEKVRAGIIVPIFQMEKSRPEVKPLAQDHTATSVLSGDSFRYAQALDLVCNQL